MKFKLGETELEQSPSVHWSIVSEYKIKVAATPLDQHIDLDAFPEDLNIFLNKDFLFKIEIKADNLKYKQKSRYTVKDMSDDVKLIEEFKKLLSMEKDTISDACKDENESSVCSTDFTPKKHAFESTHDVADEAIFQQSSTKLKPVKDEKPDH